MSQKDIFTACLRAIDPIPSYNVPIMSGVICTMERAVSSHSRSVHDSQSASQGTPRGGPRRGLLYILASIVVVALFVFAA